MIGVIILTIVYAIILHYTHDIEPGIRWVIIYFVILFIILCLVISIARTGERSVYYKGIIGVTILTIVYAIILYYTPDVEPDIIWLIVYFIILFFILYLVISVARTSEKTNIKEDTSVNVPESSDNNEIINWLKAINACNDGIKIPNETINEAHKTFKLYEDKSKRISSLKSQLDEHGREKMRLTQLQQGYTDISISTTRAGEEAKKRLDEIHVRLSELESSISSINEQIKENKKEMQEIEYNTRLLILDSQFSKNLNYEYIESPVEKIESAKIIQRDIPQTNVVFRCDKCGGAYIEGGKCPFCNQ